jgi:hypothetical protein
MPSPLPPEFIVQPTPRGELVELPPREVGCMRFVGVLAVVIGLVFAGTGLFIILIEGGVLDWLSNGKYGGGRPLDWFKAAFGVPFFLGGLVPLYLGSFLFGGRGTIELRDEVLISTLRWGPLRKRRRIRIETIRKFQVKTARSDEAPEVLGKMMGALNAVLKGGGMKNVTWGYPKATLRALAVHLTEACEQRAGAVLIEEDRPRIGIEERTLGDDLVEPEDGDEPLDVSPRPDDAVSILERHADGLTITVPPVGMRKGSKGTFGFSIFWNGFMLVFTGFWFGSGGFSQGPGLAAVFPFLMIVLFWGIGVALVVTAINAGRRRAILDVVGDTLLITRKSIFKTQQDEVRRNEIKAIRRGKTGTEVNEVPILNLQVIRREGKKIGILAQLSDDELAWIAAELREALDVPG